MFIQVVVSFIANAHMFSLFSASKLGVAETSQNIAEEQNDSVKLLL